MRAAQRPPLPSLSFFAAADTLCPRGLLSLAYTCTLEDEFEFFEEYTHYRNSLISQLDPKMLRILNENAMVKPWVHIKTFSPEISTNGLSHINPLFWTFLQSLKLRIDYKIYLLDETVRHQWWHFRWMSRLTSDVW